MPNFPSTVPPAAKQYFYYGMYLYSNLACMRVCVCVCVCACPLTSLSWGLTLAQMASPAGGDKQVAKVLEGELGVIVGASLTSVCQHC